MRKSYSSNDIFAFIKSRGWNFKEKGDDYQIQNCPFCADSRWKFYLNKQKGYFQCFHCRKKGSFKILQDNLGFEIQSFGRPKKFKKPHRRWVLNAHKRLRRSKVGKKYLKERGIKPSTYKHFKLGVFSTKNKETGERTRYLVIPQELKSSPGNFANWKARSLPPAEKTFRRFKDARTILFNEPALDEKGPIIITEGEIDAMTLWQAGLKNVIGATAGADSFDPVWFDQLMSREKIYLAYDNDAVGQKGAYDTAVRLGLDRCYLMEVPKSSGVKDWNDLYQKNPDKFASRVKKAYKNAKPYSMLNVFTLKETFEELDLADELPDEGLPTPWKHFDKVSGKMQPGDLVVLSAPPKLGKTNLALNVSVNLARKKKIPALFWCLESRPPRLLERVISSVMNVPTERIQKTERSMARMKLRNAPLYFGWCPEAVGIDQMFELLSFAVRRLGIKLLVFDHLQFLIRSQDNTVNETSNASRKFKFLAEELGITVILIAHPRKINLKKPMNYYDLRDSSSLPGDADRIWILYRKLLAVESDEEDETEEMVFDNEATVYITSRWSQGGRAKLRFKPSVLRFVESKKKKKPQEQTRGTGVGS